MRLPKGVMNHRLGNTVLSPPTALLQAGPGPQPRCLTENLMILAISGSIVGSGNQNNLLVYFAEGLELSIKRSMCGPHNQDPIIWFQELQEFGKVSF